MFTCLLMLPPCAYYWFVLLILTVHRPPVCSQAHFYTHLYIDAHLIYPAPPTVSHQWPSRKRLSSWTQHCLRLCLETAVPISPSLLQRITHHLSSPLGFETLHTWESPQISYVFFSCLRFSPTSRHFGRSHAFISS